MSDTDDAAAKEAFAQDLRNALNHLYDPAVLRRTPLAALLGVDQREDTVSRVRRVLTDCIESLKPDSGVPANSHAWRVYSVLYYRYVEQSTQREVAADLGLSLRQLGREQKDALDILVDRLWDRCQRGRGEQAFITEAGRDAEGADEGDAATLSRERELEWLQSSVASETADVTELLGTVLKTLAPLLEACGARVDCNIPEGLPPASVCRLAVKQALMNTIIVAAHKVPGGRITIEVRDMHRDLCVYVRTTTPEDVDTVSTGDDAEALAMASQLMEMSGGTLQIPAGEVDGGSFSAELVLRAAEAIAVLVVDDNADTLRLLERYLSGSRYRFVGTTDPEQVPSLATQWQPALIVMDVMLPGIDGWELLGRLREHPATVRTPIIVCTILSQEELALTLGAAEFIRKPVDRVTLLAVLDRLLEVSSTKSS